MGMERTSEASTAGMPEYDCSIETEANEEKADHRFRTAMNSSPKTEDVAVLPFEHQYSGITSLKEEGDSMAIDEVDVDVEGSTIRPREHLVEDLAFIALDFQGNQILKDSNSSVSHSSVKPDIEVQREMMDDDGSKAPDITGHTVISFHQTSETSLMNVVRGCSQPNDSKAKVIESEIVADCHSDKANNLSGDCLLLKCDLDSSEIPESVQKSSSESNHVPGLAKPPKTNANVVTTEELSIHREMVVCVGKSSSTSSAAISPLSSIPDNFKRTDTQNNTKQ